MLFRHYLLAAYRSIRFNRRFTVLNLLGLLMGITVSLVIILFVLHERSFDRFHEYGERIYKLSRLNPGGEGSDPVRYASLPPALGPALQRDFTQVENAVRIGTRRRISMARAGESGHSEAYIEDGVRITEPSFFEMFSFRLLQGDPVTALQEPMSLVLSESMVRKYFGEADPMGEELLINGEHRATVTGVIENPPTHSSITYDFLLSLPSWKVMLPFVDEPDQNWNSFAFDTFVLARPGADMKNLMERLPDYVRSRSMLAQRQGFEVDLAEPLHELYLHSASSQNRLGPSGNPGYLRFFGAVALFLLVIALLNYMNLATARALSRVREVGIRKAAGATRRDLVMQFYGEALLLVLLALPASFLLARLLLPWFGNLISYPLDPSVIGPVQIGMALAVLLLFAALLAGSYPAWMLSRFKASDALKGKGGHGGSGSGLQVRRGLIVFQFVLSTVLVIGSLAVHRQLQFMQDSSFMEEESRVLNLNLFRFPGSSIEVLKSELLALPAVRHASVSFNVPFRGSSSVGPRPTGYVHYYVDHDFVETYGLRLLAGRGFSGESAGDAGASMILNETAVRERNLAGENLEEAVGRQVTLGDRSYRVAGVVEDFHFESLRQRIQPLFMELRPDAAAYLSLRVRPDRLQETIGQIGEVWDSHTERGMEYTFMEDVFASLYQPEQRMAALSGWFTILSVFIAVLGLYGLSGYMAERRARELSIRKVFGASLPELIRLLTREYSALLGLALLLALPLAYLGMEQWLQAYRYRADFSLWLYAAACGIPLLVGLGVAALQSWKTARSNPVEKLRET